MTSTLLRLYPRVWRQRYGAEMQELLADKRVSLRTVVDLLAGAIDARINPQLKGSLEASRTEGVRAMTKFMACSSPHISTADQWRSAGWMVGGSLGLTVLGVVLNLTIGKNALSEALLYSAFPASLTASSECTYLKRYSGRARAIIAGGGALFIVLIMWAAVAIAYRI